MKTSSQDLAAIKDILSAIEEWKRVAEIYGRDSKESQQYGSKAMILLWRNAKTLDDFQRCLGSSVVTQGIITYLLTVVSNRYSFDEIKCMGGGHEHNLCLGQGESFIADLKRWTGATSDGEAGGGKGGRGSNFFWKLYEKTLKVIVDAILEKLYPK